MTRHHHQARDLHKVFFGVITVSDTRTKETDGSGRALREAFEAAGHAVVFYRLVPDEPEAVLGAVGEALATDGLHAVVTNGGTGIAPRDRTFEALSELIERPLPGFGELFRMLSYQDIGSAAMLSRATAGIARGRAIFALPGSTKACLLAAETLILPEIGHLVGLLEG